MMDSMELTSGAPTLKQLERLFRPATIAVVGASDRPGRIGGRPLAFARKLAYPGRVFGVNPHYTEVQGFPCVPRISDLPPGIDLFVLAIPAPAIPQALAELGSSGGGAAVIFSGGFAESSENGAELQAQLLSVAERFSIPVIGPNCVGFVSFHDRVPATFTGLLQPDTLPAPGGVAILSQSGGMGSNTAYEASLLGASLSHFITTGNEVVVEFGDVLRFLAADDSTHSVVGYIEGIRSSDRFVEGLRAMEAAGKRLALLKAGRSPRAARAVQGHTALMSGSDDAYEACLRRFGVHRLSSLEEMIDVVVATSRWPVETVSPGHLALATISGGAAIYMLDECERAGVQLANFSESTKTELNIALPSFTLVSNPLDLTAQVVNDVGLLRRALSILVADPSVGDVLFFCGGMEESADEIIAAVNSVPAPGSGRISIAWLGVSENCRIKARRAGIPTYGDPARFIRGYAHARELRPSVTHEETDGSGPGAASGTTLTPRLRASQLTVADFVPVDGGLVVGEWTAMQLLAGVGVRVPKSALIPLDDKVRLPAELGYPCVVKVHEPLMVHRSMHGGVVTGIRDAHQLREVCDKLRKKLGASSVLVAEQIEEGPELIVGLFADDVFGQRAVIGAGGVLANELDDNVTLIPPFTASSLVRELARLRLIRHLLRNRSDLESLGTDLSLLLEQLAAVLDAEPLLQQIECNPVVVHSHALVAVDALGTGELPDN
jgi:acetate---CoA ligase (ADP-forming)